MSKICLCLTGKTLSRDMEILNKNRKYVDIAELRVDCLDPDERFHIRSFPEMAGLPVILTIRREHEGGSFTGGESSRIALLAKGLAYAAADRRRNFTYVELEEDLNVLGLEEAARAFGTRIIRSCYNAEGIDEDLAGRLKRLRRAGDEFVKATVTPCSLGEVIKVYRAAKESEGMDKILFCMGDYSVNTGILAEVLGSRITYTYPAGEADLPPAPLGLLEPKELIELYRFRDITKKTKIFAVTGFPLNYAESPRFINTLFKIEKIDAVFVPIPSDSVSSIMCLAEEIGISGLSVTIPYKEEILSFLSYKSEEVISIGACNTVVAGSEGWTGYNTDVAGFSDSLLSFIGRKDLKGRKLTIVGAGNAAKAVASEVHRLKGKALIINRTGAHARKLAEPYRFLWAGFDSKGVDLMEKYSNLIIQTSSVGMEPFGDEDPIEFYKFSGKETVMDLVYKPEKSLCLKRAEESGCHIQNGLDMLHRTVRYQYSYFLEREFPTSLLSRVK